MIHSIHDFEYFWSMEIEHTQKIFKHLTDRALAQAITPQNRTLGRLAWHIVQTIPEMAGRTGLHVAGPAEHEPVPASAKAIFAAYNNAAISVLEEVKKNWSDATLQVKDDMYGQQWTRAFTLTVLITHQIHHRGQMTVLMRQAGLDVPGIYGPARQEWAQWGMPEPAI